jgi:hypothetical protein
MKMTREHAKFNAALRQVLSVSKEELLRREKQYQAERVDKPKPGPKPKHSSVSDHVSNDRD